MSWDKINHMFSKFNFTFTWEYGGDGELGSLLPGVFRILEGEDERSLEQIFIGCVHEASPGLVLSRPKNDVDVPYEMKFLVHPPHESFCITKIVLLSEARNVELYVNGGYEKSNRGIMLTLNKEKKSSLFEAQFDLSAYIETISNVTIKFLSHPCKDHMKLQAVVMKVEQCKPISSIPDDQAGGVLNLCSVKRFLDSVGRPLSSDAQKMLHSIENYQKSPAFKAQQMLSCQAARSQSMTRTRRNEKVEKSQISQQEEKEEEQHRNCKPEEDKTFMNMLSELGLKNKIIDDQRFPATETSTSSQARWAAYLQSRVRASKNTSPQSTEIPRSISLDGYSEINQDHQGKRTRERPNSVGCVGEGRLDHSFNPESPRQEESHDKRCAACGCPGCISVFSSISTNIFAMERRIERRIEKVDQKVTQLQENLNAKFLLLHELLHRTHVISNKDD